MADSPSPPSPSSVRIDRWLCAARVYKSRTQAQDACEGGHVRINEHGVRASHTVKVGDEVRCQAPRGLMILQVVKLAEKRLGPPQARELYIDHSPPPPPKEERFAVGLRDRGTGRPTKADRRALQKLRGGF